MGVWGVVRGDPSRLKVYSLPITEPDHVVRRYLADFHRRVLDVLRDTIANAAGEGGPSHPPDLPPMHPLAAYSQPGGQRLIGKWARAAVECSEANAAAGTTLLYFTFNSFY